MTRGVLAIAIFLLVTAFPPGNKCRYFIPFTQGATCEYERFDARGRHAGRALYHIIDVDSGSSLKTAKVSVKLYDKDDSLYHHYTFKAQCSGHRLIMGMEAFLPPASAEVIDNMSVKAQGDSLELPFNSSPGDALDGGTLNLSIYSRLALEELFMKMKVEIFDRKVASMDTIQTALGRFECKKITYSMRVSADRIPAFSYKCADWYAEGLGIVKSETYKLNGKRMDQTLMTSFKAD